MKIIRAVIAIVLALLGGWCLVFLPLWIVLEGIAETDRSYTDSFVLGACMVLFFSAAYLVQPWWRHPWRRGRERAEKA